MSWRERAAALIQRVHELDLRLSALLVLPIRPKPNWVSRLLRLVVVASTHLGDAVLSVVIWLIAWFFGIARDAVVATAVAVILTSIVISVVKFAVRRQRPVSEHWGIPFYQRYDIYAFPSGHAGRMVCLVTVLGAYFPSWTLTLAAVGAWVALSRVVLGVHHLGDILVGAAIGYSVALLTLWAVLPMFRIG